MHLGAYMKGGTIEVSGNVDGLARRGDVRRARSESAAMPADRSARPTAEASSGMTDGTIIIDGTAGLEVGMRMKRGIIAIGGRYATSPACR